MARQLLALLALASAGLGLAAAPAGDVKPGEKGAPSLETWKAAKAQVASEAAAVEARESKMSAVGKVVQLLESLRSQVLSEGEAEAHTYNSFSCFCKDTTAEKTAAIRSGEDEKDELSSFVEARSAARTTLDETIATLISEIDAAETAMKIAKKSRTETLGVYQKNSADLQGALVALEGAIASVKSSKASSFAQLSPVKKTLRTAFLLADALGLVSAKNSVAESFLQADPEVEMENYKFHSNDIDAMLEKLLTDFRSEKPAVDAAEVQSISLHEKEMQGQTDIVKRKTANLEDAKKDKASKQEEIATASAQRSTIAATLLDDQEYLRDLSDMCSKKARTWDQRSKVRQDELSALTAALSIVTASVSANTTAATLRLAQRYTSLRVAALAPRSAALFNAAEAAAEAAEEAPAFLQRASLQRYAFLAVATPVRLANAAAAGGEAVASLLRRCGDRLRSSLLSSLAGEVERAGVGAGADPFAKVKTLIQELIERLLEEASSDSNQNDWCDKATSDAEQKRGYAASSVEEHNANMAMLEATIDKLSEEISVLNGGIVDLEANTKEAEKLRAEEKAENAKTVDEATYGLTACKEAAVILDRFYKTVAKEAVEYSLAQAPADDAPDAGFKNGEAYLGSQGDATGILGMLEVIQGDFKRTISETERAEAEAVTEHLKFMTETGKSLKEKGVARDEKSKQKNGAEEEFEDADAGLQSQMELLTTAVKELLELKPVCIDTGMNYEDRVARRRDEIASLQKGLCILENYGASGPEGSADAC